MKKWLVIVCMMLAVLPANALQDLHFDGLIADEANLISDLTTRELNQMLVNFERQTDTKIAVVTIKSLDGESIEQAAIDIMEKYNISSPDKKNGVVFLTALYDREMRFQLDSGLQYKVYLSELQKVRDNEVLPNYSKGQYEYGIVQGTKGLAKLIGEAENVTFQTKDYTPQTDKRNGKYPWWVYPLAVIMSIISPRRRRYGGFGGGFGGGGFGGGFGCSGRW